MNARILANCLIVIALAGCAAGAVEPDPALSEVAMTPDRPEDPRSVRFDVPTALVMDIPGARVPNTLQARISTREIAVRELSAAGYCPRGFTGPEGVFFPGGDRSHAAFIVRCVG